MPNLPSVQKRLQHWYYAQGGGLLLEGELDRPRSAKAAFFAARDLQSRSPFAIWAAFHELRQALRRDLGMFASAQEEKDALGAAKTKLKDLER